MKNLKSIIVFLMMCVGLQIQAADIVYTKNDSVRIEKLIADAARQPKGSNIILYIGKRLEGCRMWHKPLNATKQRNFR